VLVDPSDADHITLRGEDNDSPGTVLLLILGVMIGIGGTGIAVCVLLSARRQRRILASSYWKAADVTWIAPRGRFARRQMVVALESGNRHELRVHPAREMVLMRNGLRRAPVLEIAVADSGPAVVRVPGSATLTSAKVRPEVVPASARVVDPAQPPTAKEVAQARRRQTLWIGALCAGAIGLVAIGDVVRGVLYGGGALVGLAGLIITRRRQRSTSDQ